jgi:hypothetical protein
VLVQQPVVQDPLHLQAPWLHSCPAAQVVQRSPPVPQALPDVDVTQVPSMSQQPVGHVVGLQLEPVSFVGASPTPVPSIPSVASEPFAPSLPLSSEISTSRRSTESPAPSLLPVLPSPRFAPPPSGFVETSSPTLASLPSRPDVASSRPSVPPAPAAPSTRWPGSRPRMSAHEFVLRADVIRRRRALRRPRGDDFKGRLLWSSDARHALLDACQMHGTLAQSRSRCSR